MLLALLQLLFLPLANVQLCVPDHTMGNRDLRLVRQSKSLRKLVRAATLEPSDFKRLLLELPLEFTEALGLFMPLSSPLSVIFTNFEFEEVWRDGDDKPSDAGKNNRDCRCHREHDKLCEEAIFPSTSCQDAI